ncbi:MAG: P1 family peptidase, partial [Actinomycetota bacterium]
DASVRPGPDQGAEAVRDATGGPVASGLVGAGTGATVGKWDDMADAVPAGLGVARVDDDGVAVVAIIAVNAAGWIDDGTDRPPRRSRASFGANTTIGLLVTDAALDKVGCLRAAQGGHDGLARAIVPAHTGLDGDALVAAATGTAGEADLDLIRWMSAAAVEQAIKSLA